MTLEMSSPAVTLLHAPVMATVAQLSAELVISRQLWVKVLLEMNRGVISCSGPAS
jgi:hypothetical protein